MRLFGSFAFRTLIFVVSGLVLVLAPMTVYQFKYESRKTRESLEKQISLMADALASPITNLLLLENEPEMELTVQQLSHYKEIFFVGVSDRSHLWFSHSNATMKGQPVASTLQAFSAGLNEIPDNILFIRELEFAGKSVGRLYIAFPMDFMTAPLNARKQSLIILAALLFTTIILILWFSLSIQLKPIPKIRKITSRIAQGEFGASLPTGRNDEVGQLIQSINDMSSKLHIAQEAAVRTRVLEEELHLAAEIQSALIPETVDVPDYIEVFSYFKPAKMVGGDFYFCALARKAGYNMLVADVSGKGVGSALLGSQIQGMYAVINALSGNPETTFRQINKVLRSHGTSDLYCTAVAAVMAEDGVTTFANAGHPGMRLISPDGQLTIFEGQSMALAIAEDDEFRQHLFTGKIELHPGDTLVLFSDGITEAYNIDGDIFGENRLDEVIKTAAQNGSNGIGESIVAAIEAFAGDNQGDDYTIVCATYLGCR